MAYEFDNDLPAMPMPYNGSQLAISGTPTYAPSMTPQQQQQQARSLAGALGLDDETIKLIILVAAIASIGYLIYKLGKAGSVKTNPSNEGGTLSGGGITAPGGHPGGKNRIVKIFQMASGAWYYKLLRKRSRRKGPFASFGDAKASAERRGYAVLDNCKPEQC